MTDTPDNPNRWIDGELRRVPLPEGMLGRLRAIAENGADDALDEQIVAVELPEGLLARLSAIVDDEALDRRIADVPLPDGLLASLAQIPDDELLDDAIRTVAVPGALVPSTAAVVRKSAAIATLRQWSVAAAAMIAVGVAYLAALDRLSGTLGPDAVDVARRVTELPDDDDNPFDVPEGESLDPELFAAAASRDVLADAGLWNATAESAAAGARDLVASVDRQLRRPSALEIAASWPTDDGRGALGAAPHALDLPPLESARPVGAQGAAPPATASYDRVTLARLGVHPFVDPAAHPLLESTAAPLVRSTASFDALRWRLHEEQLARNAGRARSDAPDVFSSASVRVRTEEFLAAMRYDFPPPTSGAVALRTAAGPSPFAAPNVRLLLIGVQSKAFSPAKRPPVELTIAVDVSRRMGSLGRLEIVREALREVVDRLRPEDRVSLVASGAAERSLVERVAPSNPTLRRAIAELTVEPGAALPGAIVRASAAARGAVVEASRPALRRQLVIFADAPTFVSPVQRSECRRALAAAAADGVAVSIVDVSQAASTNADLASLADAARAKVSRGASAAEARRALDEALFARSTVVANDAEMTVRFNPRSVASYRLVGHEATLGLPTAPAKISLHGGESAVVLFEVALRDDGTNDVGVAELSWTDPEAHASQVLTQPISRVQFANSLAESSISLQAAAVAAEVAEILRGVRAAAPAGEHSLDRALEVARAVHPRLRGQAEFRALVELVELARQSGLGRGAP